MIRNRSTVVKIAGIKLFGYTRNAAKLHPVLFVVSLAVISRLTVALVIRFEENGTLFPDDAGYLLLATQLKSGDTQAWTEYEPLLVRYTGLFLQPLAWILNIIPDPLAGQIMVIAWGTAATLLVSLIGYRTAGARGAWISGGVIGLIPSHVLWSSIVLKDAVVWALLAGLCMAGSGLQSEPRWQAAAARLGAMGILMTGLAFSRPHVAIISAFALLIVAPFGTKDGLIQRATMSASVAILVPWFVGFGPLGVEFLQESLGDLDSRRLAAADSNTGFIALADVEVGSESAAGNTGGDTAAAPARDQSHTSIARPKLEPGPVAQTPHARDESYITIISRGVAVVLFEPGPWRLLSGNNRLTLAAGEVLLLWYPVLVLAGIGLVRLIQRREPRFMYPVLLAAGSVLAQALVQGNLGTAYRHRAEVAVVVAVLAAVGISAERRSPGSYTEVTATSSPDSRSEQ